MIEFEAFQNVLQSLLSELTRVTVLKRHQEMIEKIRPMFEDEGLARKVYNSWNKAPTRTKLANKEINSRNIQVHLPLPAEGVTLATLLNLLDKDNQVKFWNYIYYVFGITQAPMREPWEVLMGEEEDVMPDFSKLDIGNAMQEIQNSPMFENIMKQAQNLGRRPVAPQSS